jgi:hypothetical protein
MDRLAIHIRQTRFATLAVCLPTALFLVFFNVSKHYPALVKVNVFIEDPYDAVGSFGIQLAVLSALVSFVRVLRPYPKGIASNNLVLILHGNTVSLLSIAVTLMADMIALFRYFPEWAISSAGWLLAACVGGLMTLTALAGWVVFRIGQSLNLLSGCRAWSKTIAICLVGLVVLAFYPEGWRQAVPGGILAALVGMIFLFVLSSVTVKLIFPPTGGQYEDLLDDLFALYQWVKVHANFAGFLFGWIEKLASIPWVHALANWLNPRKHPWSSVVLVALGMGVALVAAEAIGEGMPSRSVVLTVLTVFISIEGLGVLLGYFLFKRFLGIFRS